MCLASKVGNEKIRRAQNGTMSEAIGADRGFVRAFQIQFAGYLFAVLVTDFTWPIRLPCGPK